MDLSWNFILKCTSLIISLLMFLNISCSNRVYIHIVIFTGFIYITVGDLVIVIEIFENENKVST